MKKKQSLLLLTIALLLLLAGCSINNNKKDKATDDWNLEKDTGKLLDEADIIIKEKKPVDLVRFLENKMISMREKELTEIVYYLSEMQEEYLEEYNKELKNYKYQDIIAKNIEELVGLEDKKNSVIEDSLDFIEDEDLKNMLLEVYGGNYKLVKDETNYKVIINYDRYKDYENNILSEVKNYIEIQRYNQAFEEDPDCSFQELGNKLIYIEEHLKSYRKGFGYEKLLRLYSRDLRVLLNGDEKLSILEDEDKIKSNVIDAYREMSEKNTITSNAIKEYLNEIEKSNGIMTKEVKDSILTIHNKAIALLEK